MLFYESLYIHRYCSKYRNIPLMPEYDICMCVCVCVYVCVCIYI